jgi:hypothetical protein
MLEPGLGWLDVKCLTLANSLSNAGSFTADLASKNKL